MTVLCGGGASQQKPGLGTQLVVPLGLITAGLAEISGWLLPFGVLLDGFIFDLVNSCGTDPPACPNFQPSDLLNLVGGVLNPNAGATVAKISALINRWLWFQYCQCTSVATPAYDCFPGQPAGTTLPNPPNPTQGCVNGQWQGLLPRNVPGLGINTIVDCVGLCPAGTGAPIQVREVDGNLYPAQPIPSNVTSARLQMNVTCVPTAQGGGAAVTAFFYDVNGSSVGSIAPSQCTPGFADVPDRTSSVPATAKFWRARGSWLNPLDPYTPQQASAVLTATCGAGSVPAGPTSPCGPDPTTLALLSKIFDLLTLVQRQVAPFSYVSSTVHPNLVGQGEIAVSGVLGIKITPGTLPGPIGQQLGDPTELWGAGWYSWGNVDGFSNREFLTHAPQVSLPDLAGQYTRVGFSLPPGLAVTITELVRSP